MPVSGMFASRQPKPIGSSKTGSYCLSTASAISTSPAAIMTAFPTVKLARPRLSSGRSSEKSIVSPPLPALVRVFHQQVVVLDVLAGADAHLADRAAAWRADDVLHLHRFQHAHLLPRLDRVAGADRDLNDHAGDRREDRVGAAVRRSWRGGCG